MFEYVLCLCYYHHHFIDLVNYMIPVSYLTVFECLLLPSSLHISSIISAIKIRSICCFPINVYDMNLIKFKHIKKNIYYSPYT